MRYVKIANERKVVTACLSFCLAYYDLCAEAIGTIVAEQAYEQATPPWTPQHTPSYTHRRHRFRVHVTFHVRVALQIADGPGDCQV